MRKGQTELIDALAGLTDLPWELVCAGSTTRDAETTRAVRTAIERHRLTSRVHLAGVVEDEALDALYATAQACGQHENGTRQQGSHRIAPQGRRPRACGSPKTS